MTESTPLNFCTALTCLLLCACGEKESPSVEDSKDVTASPVPVAVGEEPIIIEAAKSAQPGQLTPEEQNQVIDGVLEARAKQQAEGLGSGTVKVNGAWNYTGYSELAPDPAAAIEARLVAVDVTISGHTPFFDIDDIEIVDGASLVSYGSDPHAEPLRADGGLLPTGEKMPESPNPSRWLLIYAFPKETPRFHLYYWGKALTTNPMEFGPAGLSLPYPKVE